MAAATIDSLSLHEASDRRTWCKKNFRAAYERNIAGVKVLVPPERLPDYKLRVGCGPLSAFPDVAMPDVPFSQTTDAHAFPKWVNAS